MFYFIERIIVLSRYYGIPAAVRDKSLAGTMVGNVIASTFPHWIPFAHTLYTADLGAISVIYVILFTLVVFKYARIGILIVSIGVHCLVFVHLAVR